MPLKFSYGVSADLKNRNKMLHEIELTQTINMKDFWHHQGFTQYQM